MHTILTRILLAALLVLVGCGGEEVVVVLTPATPELEAVLREADARWEAAGVAPDRIVIGEGGAPVRFAPERGLISETRTIRRGSEFSGVRWMELASLDVDNATHEMGHALGIGGGFVSHPIEHEDPEGCAPDAPDRPLMCSHGGVSISEPDLSFACTVGDCTHFTPEVN